MRPAASQWAGGGQSRPQPGSSGLNERDAATAFEWTPSHHHHHQPTSQQPQYTPRGGQQQAPSPSSGGGRVYAPTTAASYASDVWRGLVEGQSTPAEWAPQPLTEWTGPLPPGEWRPAPIPAVGDWAGPGTAAGGVASAGVGDLSQPNAARDQPYQRAAPIPPLGDWAGPLPMRSAPAQALPGEWSPGQGVDWTAPPLAAVSDWSSLPQPLDEWQSATPTNNSTDWNAVPMSAEWQGDASWDKWQANSTAAAASAVSAAATLEQQQMEAMGLQTPSPHAGRFASGSAFGPELDLSDMASPLQQYSIAFPQASNCKPQGRRASSSGDHHMSSNSSVATHSHHQSTVPLGPDGEPVKRACIACRRLKTGCDGARPCGRCAKVGRACLDRSEEEVEAAKLRRARASTRAAEAKANARAAEAKANGRAAEAASHDSHKRPGTSAFAPGPALDPNSYSSSAAATDAVSLRLYSQSFLHVTRQLGLRDFIMQWHTQLEALDLPLASLVEWHTQLHLICLRLSEQLSPDDFRAMLIDGLTEDQLHSPGWMSSPLAPWTREATRPMHYAIQTNTVVLAEHLDANSHAHDDQSVALMRIEWLPAAHIAFQRWQTMLASRLKMERQMRTMRTSMEAGSALPDPQQADGHYFGASPSPSPSPVLGPQQHLGGFQGQGHALALMPLSAAERNEDELAERFSVLGISRSLSARPPIPSEHDRVYSVHASWCPVGAKAAAAESDEPDEESKMKRTNGMNSVHHGHGHGHSPNEDGVAHHITPAAAASAAAAAAGVAYTHVPDSSLVCVCALSTPLPARIYVNAAFERFLGWRRVEVERGMRMQGFRWNRRWYPPSTWPATHRAHVTQTKRIIEMLASRLLRAGSNPSALSLRPSPSCSAAAAHSSAIIAYGQDPRSGTGATGAVVPSGLYSSPSYVTRRGELVSASFQSLRVHRSDGVHAPSAIVVSWSVPTPDHPHEPPHPTGEDQRAMGFAAVTTFAAGNQLMFDEMQPER